MRRIHIKKKQWLAILIGSICIGGSLFYARNHIIQETTLKIAAETAAKENLKKEILQYLSEEHTSQEIETKLLDAFTKLDPYSCTEFSGFSSNFPVRTAAVYMDIPSGSWPIIANSIYLYYGKRKRILSQKRPAAGGEARKRASVTGAKGNGLCPWRGKSGCFSLQHCHKNGSSPGDAWIVYIQT